MEPNMGPLTVKETFNTRHPARLSLSNFRGPVRLQTGPDDEITVAATLRPETGNSERTRVDMKQDRRGSVSVRTRFNETGSFGIPGGRQKPCEVEYLVQVPHRCDVNISVVSSETTLEGFAGTLELNTVSGDALLTQMRGRFRLSSISGDLDATGLTGSLNFQTVSGDLRMERSRISTLKGTSISGSVHLKLEDGLKSAELNTISGDVHVWPSAQTALRLGLTSVSGKILARSSYDASLKTGGHQTARLGAGGPAIAMHSLSGSLIAYNPNQFTAGPDAPIDDTASDLLDVMAILKGIEQGEMTVRQGLDAIER